MVTETECAAFLDRLYEAPFGPGAWEAVIAQFADLIGGAKAWMPDLDQVSGKGAGVIARIDPAAQDPYIQYYAERNPFIRRYAAGSWPLSVMTDEDSFLKAEFIRTEYYNDFLRPQDIHSVLVVRLARGNGVQSTLNVTRPSDKDQFSHADLDIARQLQPHVIRAFTLGRKFADLGALTESLGEALDRSRHGVLLLDDDGRIIHANAAAQRLLRKQDGLRVAQGRLSAWGDAAARGLETLIRRAARRHGARRCGGSMALSTPSRALPLSVTVAPFRPEQPAAPASSTVMVCVTDLEAGVSPPAQVLRDLFGLTQAEGRVALALLDGATPSEAAARFGVSLHTVRVQLTRIFEKTGTNRQAELIRLLTRIASDRLD